MDTENDAKTITRYEYEVAKALETAFSRLSKVAKATFVVIHQDHGLINVTVERYHKPKGKISLKGTEPFASILTDEL